MRVFHGFDSLPRFKHPVVTVGAYDGVHLGHQALISCLVAEARKNEGESVLVTFDPHPRVTLGRAEGLQFLTSLPEKLALFEQFGVDNVVVIPFDKTFSALSGAEFIQRYILGRVGAETLIVGYDHRFGHDRIGHEALAAFCDLRIVRVEERHVGEEHVSSTVIRRLLAAGRIADAERLLGHPLRVETPALVVNPERSDDLLKKLLELWHASAAATHNFLTAATFEKLIPVVLESLRHIGNLVVAYEHDKPIAFMGVEADKVEMLFVAPEYFGKGIGKQLITLALGQFAVSYVDVNEQNPGALGFYRHMGFEVFERTETDEEGNPFPILKMKLK